jgi:hypothetical protein
MKRRGEGEAQDMRPLLIAERLRET